MKPTKKDTHPKKQDSVPNASCSLCGQKYNNFAFKGGYICESCLTWLKDPALEPDKQEKYQKHAKNL